MAIDKHLNHGYSSGIPLGAGDRYYSQDLGRDFWYLLDKTGQAVSDIIDGRSKFIISGGAVSQGVGTTLNITAGVSYAPYSVTVPDTFVTIPPGTKSEDVALIRIAQVAQTNFAIPNATADGATPNYVKVKYLESNLNSRAKSKKAGSWSYEVSPSYLITVDSVAPTAYEVCLGTFLLTGGGAFTFSTTLRTFDYSLYNFEVLSAAIAVMQALPEGGMYNGEIAVTVAANNITLALKTIAGTDASASNPIYVRIAGVVRIITAALSVTRNAGSNWFNAGAAELATQEIDYFAYLGFNATDGVVIGFARIPFAGIYSDFSVTTTNETYCAISTITHAASTDVYNVIGRFAATLGANPNYFWSVPAYTNTNLIQRPIYVTRQLVFNMIAAPNAWSTTTPTYTNSYLVENRQVYIIITTSATNNTPASGTITTGLYLLLPFKSLVNNYGPATGMGLEITTWCDCRGVTQSASNQLQIYKGPGEGAWSGTNSVRREVLISGMYTI